METKKISRALISVFYKDGLLPVITELAEHGVEFYSTGGTYNFISDAGFACKKVEDLTGYPSILSGRVKTLHPKVFGGILARRNEENDLKQLTEYEIPELDLVIVDLYPFSETVKSDASADDIIEKIDIGGISLIRAAAKNFNDVCIISNRSQYKQLVEILKRNKGATTIEERRKFASSAFVNTSDYDTEISSWFKGHSQLLNIKINGAEQLRYGENPHQLGTYYGQMNDIFEKLHGKEISYNNILDLVAAVELCEDLGETACTIVKHNNPAGAAIGRNLFEAYIRALKCDPVSSFGGIVAFNKEVDVETAIELNKIFLEIVCAPSFSDGALEILKKKKDRRLVIQKKSVSGEERTYRSIPGGVLVQDSDSILLKEEELKFVTDKKPSKGELEDLIFAWKISKHTKSNAIVYVKDKATLGVGAGQMSRIDSAKIAVMKAKEHGLDLTGCVAASDAFFPFADGLIEIIKCGAVSVIQPGGSVRDQEVIDAANENNISMVFTGIRHFKH